MFYLFRNNFGYQNYESSVVKMNHLSHENIFRACCCSIIISNGASCHTHLQQKDIQCWASAPLRIHSGKFQHPPWQSLQLWWTDHGQVENAGSLLDYHLMQSLLDSAVSSCLRPSLWTTVHWSQLGWKVANCMGDERLNLGLPWSHTQLMLQKKTQTTQTLVDSSFL